MAEDGDKKNDDQKSSGPERLTREEYDRLVQGVDDFYFGGRDEPSVVKPSSEDKSDVEQPKGGDDGK
jgi:hypothetical protein